MSLPLTKLGRYVFAGHDAGGNARKVDNGDAVRWSAEIERLLLGLAADALDIEFPYGFIYAINAGSGTANAIVATTDLPLPSADAGALVALPIVATNDASPVTVAFNGGSTLTIKTNTGNDIAIGGLQAGMLVLGFQSGSTFRLLSDQVSSAIIAQAEAYALAAANSADAAEAAAALAQQRFIRVHVMDSGEGDPDTDYEAGDEIDGVTLVAGMLVARATDGGDADDGIYVVPASGAASRSSQFDDFDDLVGTGIRVVGGDVHANTEWRVTSAFGGTLGVTDILIEEFAGGVSEITDAEVAANAAIDATKLAFLRDGTGMVSRSVFSIIKERYASPFDADSECAVDDSSTEARNANKASLDAVLAVHRDILWPRGTVYLPAGAALPWKAGANWIGHGPEEGGGSLIRGDGNIILFDTQGAGRALRGLNIANENSGSAGPLVSCGLSTAQTRCVIENCYLGLATRHISVFGGFAVGWLLLNNTYEGATFASRYFTGTTVLRDLNGYSKNNARSVLLDADGLYHWDAQLTGIFEYGTLNQIHIKSDNSNGCRNIRIEGWFEGNSSVGGASDVLFEASAGTIGPIDFGNSTFINTAGTAQTVHTSVSLSGSGAMSNINTGPAFFHESAVAFHANHSRVRVYNPAGFPDGMESNWQEAQYA